MLDDLEVTTIVRALADYLLSNPLACDAADGISHWWLDSEPASMEKLHRALDWMTRHGLVEELVAADCRLRYRRCASDEQLRAAIAGLDQDSAAGL